MDRDYLHIRHLIHKEFLHIDDLKMLCESFLERHCNKEAMVKYCRLVNLIAKKEGIEIVSV